MDKQVIRLLVQVEGGCVQVVSGDAPPDDIDIEVIVRDLDNIRDGDDDPLDDYPAGFNTHTYW